jgi:hypothetical protein
VAITGNRRGGPIGTNRWRFVMSAASLPEVSGVLWGSPLSSLKIINGGKSSSQEQRRFS